MKCKVIVMLGIAIENNTESLTKKVQVTKMKKAMRLEKSATHNKNQAVETK